MYTGSTMLQLALDYPWTLFFCPAKSHAALAISHSCLHCNHGCTDQTKHCNIFFLFLFISRFMDIYSWWIFWRYYYRWKRWFHSMASVCSNLIGLWLEEGVLILTQIVSFHFKGLKGNNSEIMNMWTRRFSIGKIAPCNVVSSWNVYDEREVRGG